MPLKKHRIFQIMQSSSSSSCSSSSSSKKHHCKSSSISSKKHHHKCSSSSSSSGKKHKEYKKKVAKIADVDWRDINGDTIENDNYRHVVYTTPDERMQLVLMTLRAKETIPYEIHPRPQQFIRVESGEGILNVIDDKTCEEVRFLLYDDISVIIPAGIKHEIIAITKLQLYSIYTPKEHAHGLRQPRQRDAQRHAIVCKHKK